MQSEIQSEMKSMKAVYCTKYGAPEVLKMRETRKPIPKDNEVLVKIHATTVTAGDFRMRSFTVPPSFWLLGRLALGFTKPRKAVFGMELAGEVVGVGKGVCKYQVGDQIYAATGKHLGAYAEYICLPENGKEIVLSEKPDSLSYQEAAAVPVGARTALYFLREAQIQKGQKILIYGASGSVGTYAVQLAKHFGADVTAVCSTANLSLVQSLGADHVIDYTKEDFTENGIRYDVIFDAVGKSSYFACMKSLTKTGAYLHAVATPDVVLKMKWTSLTTQKRTVGGGPSFESEDLQYLSDLFDQQIIRPVIDRRYSLEEIVDAHRYVDKGHKKGNVVVYVRASV